MNIRIRAVYEGGVLRPTHPLLLKEGETVEVTITPLPVVLPPSEQEILRSAEAAKSLREMFEIMDSLPPDVPEDYDILKALADNRRWSNGHPILPCDGDPT